MSEQTPQDLDNILSPAKKAAQAIMNMSSPAELSHVNVEYNSPYEEYAHALNEKVKQSGVGSPQVLFSPQSLYSEIVRDPVTQLNLLCADESRNIPVFVHTIISEDDRIPKTDDKEQPLDKISYLWAVKACLDLTQRVDANKTSGTTLEELHRITIPPALWGTIRRIVNRDLKDEILRFSREEANGLTDSMADESAVLAALEAFDIRLVKKETPFGYEDPKPVYSLAERTGQHSVIKV